MVGAGWAGMAAAVAATRAGHTVAVFEAARTLGGRARSLPCTLPNGTQAQVDNGQHILIGAYRSCLELMQQVGVDPRQALLRIPLTLRFPDGGGLRFPRWPAPLDAAAGILGATGWSLRDKLALARRSLQWRLQSFQCAPGLTVADICAGLPPRVMQDLVDPLCVSALNTPAHGASAQVFLRVMQDSVFARTGDSHLLLPRQDLSALFPVAAAQWLQARGAQVHAGTRVQQLQHSSLGWALDGTGFDHVVIATTAPEAVRLLQGCTGTPTEDDGSAIRRWCDTAAALRHNPITTVYAWAPAARLPVPMLALRSDSDPQAATPAQFVFDRAQLGGPAGLLAFVVSDSHGDKDALQAAVLRQAQAQLGLQLQAVQSVVEKRATFLCTPALQRPAIHIAAGLSACGDYVEGPYPATLEAAVRAGLAAVPGAPGITPRS